MNTTHRIVALGLVAAMGAGLSGCQTMNEHRTATGAGIGAVVGAVAGGLIDSDNPWRGATIGAAAGGAVGGGIGYVLQKQKDAFDRIEGLEAEQRRIVLQPAAAPVTAQPDPGAAPPPPPPPVERDALTVTISNEMLFERGSSALSAAGVGKLREVADVLLQYPDSDVYVAGYTDSVGSDRDNYDLSLRRAEVVRDQLIAFRVAPERIYALAMGESNPIGDNNTEAGRARNRRVEINVVPRGEQR